ncbi:hypothetical protein [Actinoplanes sp. NPDC049599]|uniref:hypothetical protein n=1 Tax=Actinoplanes sp. NPDC049599 TaxID=3363903 RepID=UPI0037A8B963
MPETLEQAPPAPAPATDRAGFRLAAFAAVIVVVLFAGYGIGRLNNSVEQAQAAPAATGDGHDDHGAVSVAPHDDSGAAPHQHNADGTVTQVAGAGATAESVGGLAVTSAGMTLVPETGLLSTGGAQPYRFRITAAGGAPITTYAVVHDKPLHFVLVRRDLTGFQHLHPTMAPDGTWSINLALAAPGSYRAIADFTAVVGGRQTPATLGVDLTVAGDYRPVALPAPAPRATTDGFSISYAGTPQTGATQPLLMAVTGADGKPAPLEPYLGAFGHLVVLREGDVGYVHVHPEPQPVDGAVKFWLAAPGPGRYRMFFDFQVAGKVHTAAFTAVVK